MKSVKFMFVLLGLWLSILVVMSNAASPTAVRTVTGSNVVVTINPGDGFDMFTLTELVSGGSISGSAPSGCGLANNNQKLTCDYEGTGVKTFSYDLSGSGTVSGTVDAVKLSDYSQKAVAVSGDSQFPKQQATTCTDSDDGNKPLVFGTVTTADGVFPDECIISNNKLKEGFCYEGVYAYDEKNCLTLGEGYACNGGKCILGKPSSEAICFDESDNDGDGLTNCDDPDCQGYECAEGKFCYQSQCVFTKEKVCDDNIDDDNDGKLDCADSDCNGKVADFTSTNIGNVLCCQGDVDCSTAVKPMVCGADNYCVNKQLSPSADTEIDQLTQQIGKEIKASKDTTGKPQPSLSLFSKIAKLVRDFFFG